MTREWERGDRGWGDAVSIGAGACEAAGEYAVGYLCYRRRLLE